MFNGVADGIYYLSRGIDVIKAWGNSISPAWQTNPSWFSFLWNMVTGGVSAIVAELITLIGYLWLLHLLRSTCCRPDLSKGTTRRVEIQFAAKTVNQHAAPISNKWSRQTGRFSAACDSVTLRLFTGPCHMWG